MESSLIYIGDYTKRTIVKGQLFTKIADEVVNSNGWLEWASSSTTVVLQAAPADFPAPGDLASATSVTGR